MKTKLKRAQ